METSSRILKATVLKELCQDVKEYDDKIWKKTFFSVNKMTYKVKFEHFLFFQKKKKKMKQPLFITFYSLSQKRKGLNSSPSFLVTWFKK